MRGGVAVVVGMVLTSGVLTRSTKAMGTWLVMATVGSNSTGTESVALVFAYATRTGSGLVGSTTTSTGTESLGTGSYATGLRPKASSTSAAQLNSVGSCSVASNAVRAVGDGAGSRTSLVIPVSSLVSGSPRLSALCSPSLSTSCSSFLRRFESGCSTIAFVAVVAAAVVEAVFVNGGSTTAATQARSS
jgi:hypothetical protein